MECGTIIAWEQLVLMATRSYETGCAAFLVNEVGPSTGPAITCDNTGIGWLEALHRCWDDTAGRLRVVREVGFAEPIVTCTLPNGLHDLFFRSLVTTADGWAIRVARHDDSGGFSGDCSECGNRGVHEALLNCFCENENRDVAVVIGYIDDYGLLEQDKGCAGSLPLERILGATRVTSGIGHAIVQVP